MTYWGSLREQDDVTSLKREKEDAEYEIQRMRDEQERQAERERREREKRQREQKELYEERLRTAEDWEEAFGKQLVLLEREIGWQRRNPIEGEPAVDPYFTACRDAVVKAQQLWAVVKKEKQAEIEELQARIKAVRDGIKDEVAGRLEQACPESDSKDVISAWKGTATSIRKESPENWLNW